MSERDKYALGLGIFLGIFSGALAAFATVYGLLGIIVFIFFSILSPLLVSVMAENRIMAFGQVPNLVMTLTGTTLFLALGGYSFLLWRYDLVEILLRVLTILMMAVTPALVVSGLVVWIRRRR